MAPNNTGDDRDQDQHGDRDLVSVTIDGVLKRIDKATYTLDELKRALGVPTQRDIDIIEDGVFHALSPDQPIHVHDGMEFISRQPAGGSS